MNRRKLILYVGSVLVAFLFGTYVLAAEKKEKTIYQGVFIDKVDVSGMTRDQAIAAYSDYVKGINDLQLKLTSSAGEYTLSLGELNTAVDINGAVQDALNYGRSGNILSRYKKILALEENSAVIVAKKTFDENILGDKLENDAWDLMCEPKNATVIRVDGEFIVYAGKDGVSVMIDRTVAKVKECYEAVWEEKDLTVESVVEMIPPQYTEEDFYSIDSVIGQCTTEYNITDSSRVKNLLVATDKVTDVVLMPGEQFSMYNTVAPFTEDNGYESAGQYVNNELVDGVGGGICQVSTTLYNAVLEAELKVDERSPHSMAVNYVDKGRDAAISDGYQDFKFTNDTEYPVYISGYTGDGSVTFILYGHETRPANRIISYESRVIETYEPGEPETVYDDTLPSGTQEEVPGKDGYYVELWKNVYVDGELTDSYKVSGSEYSSRPKKIRIGTQ